MRERVARSQRMARRLRKAMTKAEIVLWTRLRRYDRTPEKFRRQHPVGPYIADVAHQGAKMIVEIDGATHGADAAIVHDAERTRYLEAMGWQVVRFTNDDVYRSVSDVVDRVFGYLAARQR